MRQPAAIISFLLVTLILLSDVSVFAQQYAYRRYTSADGLPSSTITCAYQDSRGYLWLGTDAGLSRFDGQVFLNFSVKDGLAGNFITAVAEDRDSHLWVATTSGLVKFDGYSFKDALPTGDSLVSNSIGSLLVDNDNAVWVGTSRGVNSIYKGQVRAFTSENGLLDDQVNCLALGQGGEVLVGTTFGITALHQDEAKPIYQSRERQIVMSILPVADGRIWFSTLIGQIFVKDGEHVRAVPMRTPSDLFEYNQLVQDDNGDIWLNHESALSVFQNGKYQRTVRNLPLPPDSRINTIYSDYDNDLWILSNAGLLRQKRVIATKTPLSVNGQVLPIDKVLVTSKDKVLVAADGEVFEFANGQFRHILTDKPSQYGTVSALAEDGRGNIFIATVSSGLVRYGGRGYESYRRGQGLRSGSVYSAFKDSRGRMVIGQQGNVAIFDGARVQEYPHKGMGKVLSVAQIEDRFFLGTDHGLFSFDGNEFQEVKVSDTLSRVSISTMTYYAGKLWLGTEGMGILKLDIGEQIKIAATVDNASGLGSDFVSSLQFDADGMLWAGTNNGIYRIRFDTLGGIGQVRRYSKDDGVSDDTWNAVSMASDSRGNLYVGLTSGLISMKLSEFTELPSMPQVHLTGIDISQKAYDWRSFGNDSLIFEEHPTKLTFPHHENSITFKYNGVSLSEPEKLRFRYRLEGFDPRWSTPTSERYAAYTNLPPGRYTFHVMATTGNGNWARVPQPITVIIEPPFWETWWFMGGVALIILMLVILIFRLRLRGIVRQQNEKIKVNRELTESRMMAFQAQMNPHFIFNALSSIQHFIVADQNDQALLYLGKFSKQLRQILENSKKTYVTMQDELQMLEAYIEIESMRFKDRFSYEIKVEDDLDPTEIEVPALLIQPFVENAINHGLLPKGEKGHLGIRIGERDGQVLCIVEDDGIGRAASEDMKRNRRPNHKSFGMQIAQERLNLLNREQREKTHVMVTDLIDAEGEAAGTRVEISFPRTLGEEMK